MIQVTRVKNSCTLRDRLMSKKLSAHRIKVIERLQSIESSIKVFIKFIFVEKSTEDQKKEDKKVENTDSHDPKGADDDALQLELQKHEG